MLDLLLCLDIPKFFQKYQMFKSEDNLKESRIISVSPESDFKQTAFMIEMMMMNDNDEAK